MCIRGCIQKFPDWPPGARTANGTALCHQMQLSRYFVSQSSEFCRHNPLCCFSTSVYLLLLFISLSTQSGNFLIHPRMYVCMYVCMCVYVCMYVCISLDTENDCDLLHDRPVLSTGGRPMSSKTATVLTTNKIWL
jgi:hypothetical protein